MTSVINPRRNHFSVTERWIGFYIRKEMVKRGIWAGLINYGLDLGRTLTQEKWIHPFIFII
jgi:hypothetical protein